MNYVLRLSNVLRVDRILIHTFCMNELFCKLSNVKKQNARSIDILNPELRSVVLYKNR